MKIDFGYKGFFKIFKSAMQDMQKANTTPK